MEPNKSILKLICKFKILIIIKILYKNKPRSIILLDTETNKVPVTKMLQNVVALIKTNAT